MHTVLQRQIYLIIMKSSYMLLHSPRKSREPVLKKYPWAIFIQLLLRKKKLIAIITINVSVLFYDCSVTSLIQPPLEPNFMAFIMRWPH